MRNVSDKMFRENQNTRFVSNNVILFFENHAVYDINLENIVEPGRPQMTIQHGACAFHPGQLRLQTHTQNT